MTAVRRLGVGLVTALVLALVATGVGVAMTRGTGPDLPVGDAAPVAQHPRTSPTPSARPTPTPSVATPSATPSATPTPTAASTPTPTPSRKPLRAGQALLSPGENSDQVRDLQARLRQIYWYAGDVTGSYDDQTETAVRGFQQKRQIPVTGVVDQRTLDRLTAMTAKPGYREMHNLGNKPGPLDPRCTTGRVICIDKTSRTLRWVVDGHVLKTVDVRFGAYYSPTREGLFHVYLKDADHVSHLYDSSMPYSMFFSGGQAVHYSSDFAARGYEGASHGCVNVRDYDAVKWLYSQVQVGDSVVVYWS